MLTIRREQMSTFAQQAEEDFIARMVSLLRHCFPGAAAALDAKGKEVLASHVRTELFDARSHGLVIERDIASYINLSMVYGAHYPDQPQNQWMRAMLADAEVPSPSARIHRLLAAARRKLQIEENNRRIRRPVAR